MTIRVLFVGEGTSDRGIANHIEYLAARADVDVAVTAPALERLPTRSGHSVAAKLQAVKSLGHEYNLVAVHRDADRDGRERRVEEITKAMRVEMPGVGCVPVIPVRMTEAWLLVDEPAIRRVAGNPNGRCSLNLPSAARVEEIPDPKELLHKALESAAELSGRRLDRFRKRFSEHRQQLLERLDPEGPVTRLSSWRHFVDDVRDGLDRAVN